MRGFRPMPGWIVPLWQSLQRRPPPGTARRCVNLYRFPDGLVLESTLFARIIRPHMDLPARWLPGDPSPLDLGKALRQALDASAFWTNGMTGPEPDVRFPSSDPGSGPPQTDLTVERLRRISNRPKGKALWSAAKFCLITRGAAWRDGPEAIRVEAYRNEGRGGFTPLDRLFLTSATASEAELGCLVLAALDHAL